MRQPPRFLQTLSAALVFTLLASMLSANADYAGASSTHDQPTGITCTPNVSCVIDSSGGTLDHIVVGADTTMQLVYPSLSTIAGEVYPPGAGIGDDANCSADSGVWVTINGTVYGPDIGNTTIHCAGTSSFSPGVAYTPVGQTSSGSGTSGDPFVVQTTVNLAAGISLQQTITYVSGDRFYHQHLVLNSTSPVSATLFHGADIYLYGSDTGYGYLGTNNTIGGRNVVDSSNAPSSCGSDGAQPGPFYELLIPETGASFYDEQEYGTVWDDIQASASGAHLPNTVHTDVCEDNGAALEWDNVSAGSAVDDFGSFSPTGAVIPTVPTDTPSASPTSTPTATAPIAPPPAATSTATATATPPASTATATLPPPTATATPLLPSVTATLPPPTSTPPASSASHFTNFVPSLNGFGFADSGVTGSAPMTTDMFMHEFGLTHLSPLDEFVYDAIYKNVGAGGLSYGYAVASGLNYLHVPQPGAGPYALNVTGNLAGKQPTDAANPSATASTILNAIAFYHGTQTTAQAQQQESTDRTSQSVGDLLSRIESSIAAGQPALLDISGPIQGLGTQGHSLLAFAYNINATDPQHASAPAVLVNVYDPSYPKVDDQAVTFWRDASGQWHWYYLLFPVYLPYQNSPVIWSGPGGGNTNLDVPSLQLAAQQGTEPSVATKPVSYLEFENTGTLSISDSRGHTSSISGVGVAPQGTIPGLIPVVPEDATNVPGSGMLFIPETSAFTITQTLSGTTTSDASLSLVGPNGLVQVTQSGTSNSQPLTLTVDQTGRDLHFGAPAVGAGASGVTGTLSVTFSQGTASGSRSYTLTGLPADVQEVRLAPDGQSVLVKAGATAGTYSLAITSASNTGTGQAGGKASQVPGLAAAAASSATAPSTSIYTGLALAAGASQVARPGEAGGAATITTTFAAGSPHPPTTQNVTPARAIAFDGGSPVAPGASVAVHAGAGTFSPNQKFTLSAGSALPPGPGYQAAADGSFSGTFRVPATAASGSFVISTGGGTPASGLLQIVKGTIQLVSFTGTPPPLVIHNNRRTVVGGRKVACTLAGNINGKFQAGCETVSSILYAVGAPGATVTYVLTYANGTKQTFTGTADRHGNALHPFNVVYLPPPGSKHGQPATIAYVSVSAKLKKGTTLGPVTTRFAVIR